MHIMINSILLQDKHINSYMNIIIIINNVIKINNY
jgi:hypothetical protein